MSSADNPTTSPESPRSDGFDRFVEASGCPHIIRAFRMAIEPRVWAIALAAITATFLLGIVLDAIYLGLGGGVRLDAIDRFIENPSAAALDSAVSSPATPRLGDAAAAHEQDARPAGGTTLKKRPLGPPTPVLTREELKRRASDKPQADHSETAHPPASVAPDDSGALSERGLTKGPAPSGRAKKDPSASSPQPKEGVGDDRPTARDKDPASESKTPPKDQPVSTGRETDAAPGPSSKEDRGGHGVFEVWRKHERAAVLDLLTSSIPGTSVVRGSPVARYFVDEHTRFSPVQSFTRIYAGVWWFFRYHTVYFLVFFVTGLAIWSICGGAICRIAAVQFARDEKITHRQALDFAWRKRDALFFAPCVPLGFMAVVAVAIMLIGAVMRVPVLDVLSVVLFPISMLLGGLITLISIGLLIGGSLFWPAVATDGVGAFDAFGRAFAYTLPRPWKTIQYVVITLVYAGLCCLFVNLFTFAALWVTRALTGIGSSWFGAWPRGGGSKMGLLWPTGSETIYAWPTGAAWHEYPAAIFVGLTVLLVLGILWSFIASFFFSSSTIGYFLLRRDVDGTDLHEIHWDDHDAGEPGFEATAAPQPDESDIPLPTVAPPPDPEQT